MLVGAGGALTVIGTWLGSFWQSREASKARSERFAREDRFRQHDQRTTTYASFYQAAGNARAALNDLARTGHEPGRPAIRSARGCRNALWTEYTTLRLIGARDAWRAASSLLEFVTQVAWGDAEYDDERYDQLVADFVRAARSDLLGTFTTDANGE